jgi:DNA repair protein RecO (recombination protein O)
MATRRAAPATLAAYVLHHHDWSESSLILDLYTRELGRIVAVAKGAKRPGSQLRCVLLPFQRLNIALGSKRIEDGAEVQLLRSAEWAGGPPMPGGAGLLAGLHLNELLLRGLARHDPHPELFDAYAATLPALGAPGGRDPAAPSTAPAGTAHAADDGRMAAALRAFELRLLLASGLLPDLGRVTATQARVDPAARLWLHAEAGVCLAAPGEGGLPGSTLLALQQALDADDLAALQRACQGAAALELKGQLRSLLHYHLGTAGLRTRALMVEVQQLFDRARPARPSRPTTDGPPPAPPAAPSLPTPDRLRP